MKSDKLSEEKSGFILKQSDDTAAVKRHRQLEDRSGVGNLSSESIAGRSNVKL